MFTLLDACEFVLDQRGEPQSSEQVLALLSEWELARLPEEAIREALLKDIQSLGDKSRFVALGNGLFALREWHADTGH